MLPASLLWSLSGSRVGDSVIKLKLPLNHKGLLIETGAIVTLEPDQEEMMVKAGAADYPIPAAEEILDPIEKIQDPAAAPEATKEAEEAEKEKESKAAPVKAAKSKKVKR